MATSKRISASQRKTIPGNGKATTNLVRSATPKSGAGPQIRDMKHEFKFEKVVENRIEQWAIFERRYSPKWLQVAKCSTAHHARVIVTHLSANIRNLYEQGMPGGWTCVSPCSINQICDACKGTGSVAPKGSRSLWTCPVCIPIYEEMKKRREQRLAQNQRRRA